MTLKEPKRRAAPRARAPTPPPERPTHVVGVGGSAGSLRPLQEFFGALAGETTMCFIVVTHRDPNEKTVMPQLLSRFTRLRVSEAVHGAKLERGAVHVVPSDKLLALRDGCIALVARAPEDRWRPIDAMFRAIAGEAKDCAVGVVLSGMGEDGAAGLAAIKEELGLVLVQDPTSADFDAMPKSALATSGADIVAEPAQLARKLNAFVRYTESNCAAVDSTAILSTIRAHTGHDFGQYKKSTIERRIERRMGLHHLVDLPAYLAMLERDPHEIDRLVCDLLIGVTRFFRDPEVFEALKSELTGALDGRPADRPFRVWVAGCATGEEAYSIAILLREIWDAGQAGRPIPVQIYATDLDKSAVDRARRGRYGHPIALDVSPARLARYFVEEAGGYRVMHSVREMVVFAHHNIISDPPFTKLDLVSCRNVLIYWDATLQRRALSLFLYSLVPGGHLLISTSEVVAGLEDGFHPVDGKNKIYRRREMPHALVDPRQFSIGAGVAQRVLSAAVSAPAPAPSLRDSIEHAVIELATPPVIVVDKAGNLLYASRRTSRYFELPAGRPNTNVFAMAREGLALPLRTALRKAFARGARVTEKDIPMKDGRRMLVNLSIWLLRSQGIADAAMIAITEVPPKRRALAAKPASRSADRAALVELRRTKAHLESLMAEMARSQETLQGMNEDLESANEELQSTNEEITSSKEEIQSMNEELLSLNTELQATNEELVTTNDDMRNLLDSSQIPTLFLDRQLRLKRFTDQASRIARLIPADVGRAVTDLAWSVAYDTLEADVREVLRTLVFKDAEVTAEDGSVYRMRIHPYRTMDDIIDGVVITFIDITAYRRRDGARRQSS